MTALLMETTRDLTTRQGDELKRREGQKPGRPVVRSLVLNADALAGIILSSWKWLRETLEGEGFEGRELAQHCRVLLEGIDKSLAGYDRLLAMTEESGLTLEEAGLHDLEARLPALRETRARVAGVLDLAARPPRPVDEKALAEATDALERGKFIPLDDEYLARLAAGEDL